MHLEGYRHVPVLVQGGHRHATALLQLHCHATALLQLHCITE